MSKNEENIFKIKKERNYVSIDNRLFIDDNLSWKAKGILGYLLSRPTDWQVFIYNIVDQSTDGRESVMSGLDELEKSNYLYKEKRRNDKGHFKGWIYYIFESPSMNKFASEPRLENPKSENPISDKPTSGKPKSEKPTYTNKENTNNDLTKNRSNKKNTTTISKGIDITPEIKKVIGYWNKTFEIEVDVDDQVLMKAIWEAVNNHTLKELFQAIKFRSLSKFYKEDVPYLRDNPKKFFEYPGNIKNDMKRYPYKLVTYDKKCELEQQGTDKKFEMDPDKKDGQGRAMWRMYE